MKYTVIYVESKMIGSHMNSLTKFERIECRENESLKEALVRLDLTNFAVFIFEGWPKLEGE